MTAAQEMVPTLLDFLAQASKLRVPTIYVRQVQNDWTVSDAQKGKRGDGPALCWEGTFGVAFYKVEPRRDDHVITKHRYSAFIGTDLDLVLKSCKIQTLVLTGVSTNTCVESTARDGFMLEYFVVVLSDCVATHTTMQHQAGLDNIGNRFGYITTSKELLNIWRRGNDTGTVEFSKISKQIIDEATK